MLVLCICKWTLSIFGQSNSVLFIRSKVRLIFANAYMDMNVILAGNTRISHWICFRYRHRNNALEVVKWPSSSQRKIFEKVKNPGKKGIWRWRGIQLNSFGIIYFMWLLLHYALWGSKLFKSQYGFGMGLYSFACLLKEKVHWILIFKLQKTLVYTIHIIAGKKIIVKSFHPFTEHIVSSETQKHSLILKNIIP